MSTPFALLRLIGDVYREILSVNRLDAVVEWPALCSTSDHHEPSGARLERDQDSHHEHIVDCDGLAAGATRHVKSQVVQSPDLKSYAYVETTAEALMNGECVNGSRLYVKLKGDPSFRLVILQTAEEYDLGNKFIFIDWSPDSQYILFERMLFQYGSDAPPDIEAQLYVVSDRYLRTLSLKEIDEQFQRRECLLYLRPAGFSKNGHVIIEEEIHPYIDPGDDNPRDATCPNRTTLWEAPMSGSEEVRQLPPNYEIPRLESY